MRRAVAAGLFVAVASATTVVATPALAQSAPPAASRPAVPTPGVVFRSKKDHRLAQKDKVAADPEAQRRWRQQLDARVGAEPDPVINVYSLWHREFLPIAVDDELRKQLRQDLSTEVVPPESGNRLLRCHFTQQPTDVDRRLLTVVTRAALHFDIDRVNVVSGYRAPKYNLILQKKGREVARSSQHSLGHAIDFRLPGVNIDKLHRFVRGLRLGGVGFYTHSKFIHADTGKVRYWNGR